MIDLAMDYEKFNNAIYNRKSIRIYEDLKLDYNDERFVLYLKNYINSLNCGVKVEVVFEKNQNRDICNDIIGAYGKIKNCNGYFILLGDKHKKFIEDYVGYLGEYIILNCTSKGLGTCWISGNFKRTSVIERCSLKKSENIYSIILFGYEDKKENTSKRERNSLETLIINKKLSEIKSKQVLDAINAARLAPSLLNRQPWRFEILENGIKIKRDRDIVKSKKLIKGKRIDIGTAIFHIIVSLGFNKIEPKIILSECEDIIAVINFKI